MKIFSSIVDEFCFVFKNTKSKLSNSVNESFDTILNL